MTNISLEEDNDDDDKDETLGWHGLRLFNDDGNLILGEVT